MPTFRAPPSSLCHGCGKFFSAAALSSHLSCCSSLVSPRAQTRYETTREVGSVPARPLVEHSQDLPVTNLEREVSAEDAEDAGGGGGCGFDDVRTLVEAVGKLELSCPTEKARVAEVSEMLLRKLGEVRKLGEKTRTQLTEK